MKRLALPLIALVMTTGVSPDPKLTEHQRAVHVLNRLAFGPRPGDVDKVLEDGIDVWIDQQLHPDAIPDRAVEARLQNMPTLLLSNGAIMDAYYKPLVQARRSRKADAAGEAPASTPELMAARQKGREVVEDLVAQRIIRAAESDRQLNEVMVDFWFNHFNVFIGKGPDRFMITSYERDAIRPRIWGRFEDLLTATAKSPAMLFYLDNARSRGGALNENYAREIMELHTLGVDAGYTQKDVTELARVFTGWTIDQRSGTFIFRPRLHDNSEKTVLGVHFRAGGGIEEGEQMIHILAHHPATAHHIALQLCQRLVSDNPPKALVDRVAKKFLATDGDLRETVRAIIDSPEFWDPKQYRAKVKSPFEYVISAVRAVHATVDNPLPIARALQQIGEPLYGAQPPTGYSDRADVWINTGALMNRLNFALALAANKLPGVHSDVVSMIPSSEAADAAQSVDALAAALIGGDLSGPTRATIKSRIVERDNTQIPMVAGLILGSPEFQRQ
ncbi:MAG TPA: DUF1800 domain-containing protein [Thermoanaerobaculia bacterium]